jgi:hypothetical protein
MGAAGSFGPSTTEGTYGITTDHPEAGESEPGASPARSWPCLLGIFQGVSEEVTDWLPL